MAKFVLTGLFVLIVFGFSSDGFSVDNSVAIVIAQANDGGSPEKDKRRGPPPEAVEACEAQSVGYTCSFMSPQGDVIEGVCEIMPGDIIACLPDNRPPHHKGNHDGAPPDDTPPPDQEF